MFESNQPLVSIIIVFYNEEKLVSRCLQSVKNQTYKNLEVILIDDGSTDDSIAIAEKFRNDFDIFKLISITNSGQSEARNIGLQNCTGEYVTFLDADDEFESTMISTCIDKMIIENTDLVICKFSIISILGKVELVSGWKDKVKCITKGLDLIPELFTNDISETVWGKMYKSEIAKKITFEKDLWFDDMPYVFEYLFLTDKVCFLDDSLLKIHKRENSITRRRLENKRILDYQIVFKLELNILKKYTDDNELKNKIAKHYLDVLVDHYLFQIIDMDYIVNLKIIRKVFDAVLIDFKNVIRKEKIKIKSKDKLLITLLGIHRYIGWTISNQIIKFLKKRRISTINKLR